MRFDATAVCVMGMHRSGTSMVAHCLQDLGIYFGRDDEFVEAAADNPDGFWEHAEIVDLQESFLLAENSPWYVAPILTDDLFDRPRAFAFQSKLIQLLRTSFSSHSLWGWKDPRTILLWKAWKSPIVNLEVEVKHVLVVRRPSEVAASLAKRNGYARDHALTIWCLHVLQSFVTTQGEPRALITFDHLFDNPTTHFAAAFRRLELPWPGDEKAKKVIESVVKPSLRHAVAKSGDLGDTPLASLVERIQREVDLVAGDQTLLDDAGFNERMKGLHEEFLALVAAFRQSRVLPFHTQIFYSTETGYAESDSRWSSAPADGQFHDLSMTVPVAVAGNYRFDPTNTPSVIEVAWIRAWACRRADGRRKVAEWGPGNIASGFVAGSQCIVLESPGLVIAAPDDDPFIYLNVATPLEPDEVEIVFDIRLRVVPLDGDLSLVMQTVIGSEENRFEHNALRLRLMNDLGLRFQSLDCQVEGTRLELQETQRALSELLAGINTLPSKRLTRLVKRLLGRS